MFFTRRTFCAKLGIMNIVQGDLGGDRGGISYCHPGACPEGCGGNLCGSSADRWTPGRAEITLMGLLD